MLLAEAHPESLGSPEGSTAWWQCQSGLQHSDVVWVTGITAARAPGLPRCVPTSALLVLAVPPQGLRVAWWVLVMAGLCSTMKLLLDLPVTQRRHSCL